MNKKTKAPAPKEVLKVNSINREDNKVLFLESEIEVLKQKLIEGEEKLKESEKKKGNIRITFRCS